MQFYGPTVDPPETLSLKARLAWKYLFTDCWQITATNWSAYIVTDESGDLEDASIYPEEEELVEWLESTADAHLADDPVSFLKNVVDYPELITEGVAEEIKKIL